MGRLGKSTQITDKIFSLFCAKINSLAEQPGDRSVRGRSDTTENILVVRTAVSVLVMVVVMMRSGVVVFLVQGGRVGGAEALPLLLGLLQDTAVGKGTEPAQQFPIHLQDK